MAKDLTTPKNVAPNGTTIDGQWYKHSIMISQTNGADAGYIYIYNKKSTRYTLIGDVFDDFQKFPHSSDLIIAVSTGNFSDESGDTYSNDCVMYFGAGSTTTRMASTGNFTLASDTVTPY